MESTRRNNLDLIRFLAATAVILGHAFPLNQGNSPVFLGNSIGALAVKIFFCMSGVLITESWLKDPSLVRYLSRRALRIFPALAFVLVVSALVIGPVVTTVSMREYLSSPRTWRYLGNLSLKITYDLPGVFQNNPYPGAVNGSLWSLPIEFLMYLWVPLVFVLRDPRARRAVAVAAGALFVGVSLYLLRIRETQPDVVVYGTSLSPVLDVAPYFAIGAMLVACEWHRKFDAQHAALAALVSVLFQTQNTLATEMVLMVVVPILTLGLGFATQPRFSEFGKRGDFSYGIYLWGWPAQQLVTFAFGHAIHPLLNFALAAPLAIACAAASWHLVEKRALSFRPRTVALRPTPSASPV